MIEFTNSRYILNDIIGEGNFGTVYKAFDNKSGEYVAIKIEKKSPRCQIETEVEVLTQLNGCKGFSKLIDHGKLKNNASYLVMELLGKDIQTLITGSKKKMHTEKVLEIGKKCLKRIKTLHNKQFIHRDIKPRQFLMGTNSRVYLIDFGLARRYMSQSIAMHISYSDNKPFVGTMNYASSNTHQGIQQSRRDDLESFCYTLSYLLNGQLP